MKAAPEELVDDIAQFTRDPLGFCRYAYPWGEPGVLQDEQVKAWQEDILSVIGKHLKSPFCHQPRNVKPDVP